MTFRNKDSQTGCSDFSST